LTSQFEEFLKAADLDDLESCRVNLTELDSGDTVELIEILRAWLDKQAIANILMYPELIPGNMRLPCIQKALSERNFTYFVLAAVVGISRLNIDEFSEKEQDTIVLQVITRINEDQGIIAERASVFLADNFLYFRKQYYADVVGFLYHSSDLVRHNTLAMLLSMFGLIKIRGFLNKSVESGLISTIARAEAENRLSAIPGYSENNIEEASQFNFGNLGVPWLSYIPNLVDFSSK